MTRPWDRFLSERDAAHVARVPRSPVGFGVSPVLLLVDNYRSVLGDRPEPLLEAIDRWPGSTGLEGWEAVGHIEDLLAASRKAGIPVVHVTGLEEEVSGIAGWWDARVRRGGNWGEPDAAGDRRRRYEIHPSLEPIAGEALLKKIAPSAFWGTPLVAHLQHLRADTIIIAGESTSGCVRATVIDAASHRYRVIIPEECVYDRHEASHAINLFDMHRKYADVLPLTEVLDWVGDWSSTGEEQA